MCAAYKTGMNLTPYLREYGYFPDFTKFVFGELADKIRERGYLLSTELVLIYVWKNFWRRDLIGAKVQGSPAQVEAATRSMFNMNHESAEAVKDVLHRLSELFPSGSLATKVASCILTIVFPEKYGIIDDRVLHALNLNTLDEETAVIVFFKLRKIAEEQQRITGETWTPRLVDMALWQLDRSSK